MMFFEDELLRRLDLGEEAASPRRRPLRVAVYSHDAEGLGHLRRNLLISRALLAGEERPSVLLISGLRESAGYDLPQGVDRVTLPALSKNSEGGYQARSLHVEIDELVRLRSEIIHAAVASFRPDVLIVDKLPLGIFGELRKSLSWLREMTGAKLILGLRDILDEPETVQREWARDNCVQAIRDYYDRVWVYGDQHVYDLAEEYSLPADIAAKTSYVGYLNPRHVPENRRGPGQSSKELAAAMDLPADDITLCVIGGGRDGLPLASEFLRTKLPPGSGGILVTGPLMDGEDRTLLHSLAAERDDIRLIEFVTDPQPLMCCANRVISMGGYNTVAEVLAHHKPALIVPRVKPRREQIIRAERFAEMGLLDMLHPEDLTADALSAWICANRRPANAAEAVLDFDGAKRLPLALAEALSDDSASRPTPHIPSKNGTAASHV